MANHVDFIPLQCRFSGRTPYKISGIITTRLKSTISGLENSSSYQFKNLDDFLFSSLFFSFNLLHINRAVLSHHEHGYLGLNRETAYDFLALISPQTKF